MIDLVLPMGILQVGHICEHFSRHSLQMRCPFSHWNMATLGRLRHVVQMTSSRRDMTREASIFWPAPIHHGHALK